MSKFIDVVPPHNVEEVLHVNLWWTTHYIGINFGFSPTRAAQLWRRGFYRIAQLWDRDLRTFRPWPQVQESFGLRDHEQGSYMLIQRHFPVAWRDMLLAPDDIPQPDEWLGFFERSTDELPLLVFRATEGFRLTCCPTSRNLTCQMNSGHSRWVRYPGH
jgi:hypothetical protein